MTAVFAQSVIGDVATVLSMVAALVSIIGGLISVWKWLDERGRRRDAERREQEVDVRNIELETENAVLRGRKTDGWGCGVETQAARINELLSGTDFRTTTEVYDALIRDFPATTRARVSAHIQWLRKHHRPRLLEQRDGHAVSFRLASEPAGLPAH